jgi:hypothetical protein
MTCIILQDDSGLAKDQPRAAEHYSGSGDSPSGHETEFAEDQPEVPWRWRTWKGHYIAPPSIPTNPESRPIIKPVGQR